MMIPVLLATLFLAVTSNADAQVQNKEQVICIRTLATDAVRVGKLQGKANRDCLKLAAKSEAAGAAQECLTLDESGKMGDAIAQAIADDADRCTTAPNFAYATGAEAADAARDGRLKAFEDLFGSDLDTSATACATNKDGCRCQFAVAKAAEKLLFIQWKTFTSCQKSQLDAATSAADIARCVDDAGTPASIAADPKDKIAKAELKLLAAIAGKCDDAGVTVASLAQGSCAGLTGSQAADCIENRVRCNTCIAVARAEELTIDCDAFDDGIANASCVSVGATCNPLSPLGMQGCGANEKCTWVTAQDLPDPEGELACVADGTVAIGGACTHGPAGETTGFDNCAAGGICVGATCHDVCGFDGSANASCSSGEACGSFDGLGADVGEEPVMGACLATCDPLHQTGCGVNQGCYLLDTFNDTIAVCAGAGTPTHNQPISGPTYANSCAPGHIPRRALQGVTGDECAGLCKPADVYNGSNDGRSGRPDYEGGNSTETNWMTPAQPATCQSAGGATVLPAVPTTGESCRPVWVRESHGVPTEFSNTLGWCFNHANWKYDPDGAEPLNNTDAYPRCIDTTTGDVLPPVNTSTPHNDAIYFGCMSQVEPPAESDGLHADQPNLRLDLYR